MIYNLFKIVLLSSLTLYSYNYAWAFDKVMCDFERMYHLIDMKESGLSIIEKNNLSQSSEGSLIKEYWDGDELKIVRVIYYGETGKSELSYYPSDKDYLVKVSDYFYTVPIYLESSKIVSIKESIFAICHDIEPNYPNSSSLDTEYKRALSILNQLNKTGL
ncbi:hypothetical protein VV99796_03917 [Vibrio vulnificus]|nr:hypothetical protein VV99796_03917 [Vibrio vulnificus]OJI45206.1 hypothetical protein VVS316_03432 [Vibrio vulnificus]POB07467.1 hypothetical protein CRN33_08430 [Vibrio vulnificus]